MVNIDDVILAFLEQRISSEELQKLRDWVKESAENKAYFKKIQDAWLLSAASNKNKFHKKEAYQSFLARTQSANRKKETVRRVGFKQFFYYAACIALAFVVGIGTKYMIDKSHAGNDLLAYEVEAPRKTKLKVNMPDGSIVWLNADSKLCYNNKFGIDNRDLSLRGEGYFEISKNPELPLVVALGEAKVKVLGTKFNVQNYQNDDEIQVALLEGSVNFSNNGDERSVVLKPDQLIKYNKRTGITTLKDINTEYSNSWINGNVFFNEEKLGYIAKVLERSFNVTVSFENEDLKNLIFYGDLTIEADNIVQVMDIMCATNKFNYRYDAKEKKIYILH